VSVHGVCARQTSNDRAVCPYDRKGNRTPTSWPTTSGRSIIALLQKAAEMAKEDWCARHGLGSQAFIPAARSEERVRELEADAGHFRDRAARAEAWLLRIHNEVEQTFFQKKEPRQNPRPRGSDT